MLFEILGCAYCRHGFQPKALEPDTACRATVKVEANLPDIACHEQSEHVTLPADRIQFQDPFCANREVALYRGDGYIGKARCPYAVELFFVKNSDSQACHGCAACEAAEFDYRIRF